MSVPAKVASFMFSPIIHGKAVDVACGAPDCITNPSTTITYRNGVRAVCRSGARPASRARQRVPAVVAFMLFFRSVLLVTLFAEVVPLRRRHGCSFALETLPVPALVAHMAHRAAVHLAAVVAHKHPVMAARAPPLDGNGLLAPAVVTVVFGRLPNFVLTRPVLLE